MFGLEVGEKGRLVQGVEGLASCGASKSERSSVELQVARTTKFRMCWQRSPARACSFANSAVASSKNCRRRLNNIGPEFGVLGSSL